MPIFILKLVALLSMFIDHFAYIDFQKSDLFYTSLRSIGRLSFPLYIFIITESLYFTKNRKNFLRDLFIIGVISQPLFYIYFDNNLSKLNVLFTLFLGAFIVYNIDNLKISFKNRNITLLTLSLLIPLFINVDYSFIGVYSIPILYYAKRLTNNNNVVSALLILAFCAIFYLNASILYFFSSSLSAIFILFYNKKEGKKFKRHFQISYPLHILIYIIINTLLNTF